MGAATVLFLLSLAVYTCSQTGVEAQGPVYTVELLMVMDKRAYDAWYAKTPGSSEGERYKATVKRITEFLSAVVTGINTLYESVHKYGLALDVRLKKIHILRHDLWEKKDLRFGYDDQIPTLKAIDKFYNWSWKARDTLGTFDHAMLVTGYNVIDPNDPRKLTTGVAYKGVMCKYGSVSVVENTFTYQMIDTAAHELGHSLGSHHDGENNYCDNNLGYVMSSRTEINSTYRWSFSPCSSEAIKHNIAELNGINANCLVKTATNPTPGKELGAMLSADEQCRMIMGPEAFFCRDFYDSPESYSKMCASMWCSASQRDSHCQNHIASDGFVCGNNKVCKRGACIPAPKQFPAPVADTCPQGDQPGIVFQNMTCAEVGSKQPWLCYGGFFQRKCCLTCPRIKENVPGCEYGDKEGWCSEAEMKYPYDCYLNEKICCKSCKRYKRPNQPGCDYGDQNIECKTKLSVPIGCYENEALCCETCAEAKSLNNIKCPYGDRSTWCKEKLEVPNGCYLNEELCCGTCGHLANATMTKRIENAPDDKTTATPSATTDKPVDWCMYGDRYPDWCLKETPYRCYNSTVLEWCCESCAKYENASQIGCEYGNKFKNCDELVYPYACYHPKNADSCCWTCGMYRNASRPDCQYGDKQWWCYKQNVNHKNDKWCHLDKEEGHCCGTCVYLETAIPVLGSKVRSAGLPTPKKTNH
ncbi:uncharacterized protein [Littorina saxatilis]|uniref:Peptidase M12B domain-containing protein n=1 Tax=Littorina saxatilis TaxID=31220 RepID=A0AAN9C1D4_9CAEN